MYQFASPPFFLIGFLVPCLNEFTTNRKTSNQTFQVNHRSRVSICYLSWRSISVHMSLTENVGCDDSTDFERNVSIKT